MKKLLLLLLLFVTPCFGQLVLAIAPNGAVSAPIDTNGWQNFKVTLTQNISFSFVILPPAPPPTQSTLRVIFTQDATGGRSATFAANIANPCAISVGANTTTICTFTFDNSTNTWQGIGGGNAPALVAKADQTAQAANIGNTTLYAVPANGAGTYRINAYVVVTQQATVSATMPSVVVVWTDADTNSGTSATFTPMSGAANPVVGVSSASSTAAGVSVGVDVIQVKAGANIQYSTTGYASSGATPMQYAVHVKLEFLGP